MQIFPKDFWSQLLKVDSDLCKGQVKLIVGKDLDPVIIFSFSKAECEALALQMAKLDLIEEDEKKTVESVYESAMDNLGEEDRKLPQVNEILYRRPGLLFFFGTQVPTVVILAGVANASHAFEGNRCSPFRTTSHCEGGGGDTVFRRAPQGFVCH